MCSTLTLLLIILSSSFCFAADDSKSDPRYPFRTDFANASLPWYKPGPGEFPPHHSDHRVSGELVTADFIHRTGQFRTSKSGELVDFTMPPYGAVMYLNAEADLRDVPLGTCFLFFLNQDAKGGFTRLATMLDEYSIDAGHSFSYRLDTLQLDKGTLQVTKQSIARKQPDLGKRELLVTSKTRVWKGDKQVKLTDLAAGDDLLFNLTAKSATSPDSCTDIYVGVETHAFVTQRQRTAHFAFVKARGLPAWIDRIDGNKLTVTLFSGDAATFKQTYLADFAAGKDLKVAVANDELRTWNPGTDGEKSKLLEIQTGPTDSYGASGIRFVVSVTNMLEGFRKGRIVRIFGPGWPVKDSFYGESLMNYGYSALRDAELVELTPKEYPAQFPFRTDYCNDDLPWYQLKSGEFPPRFSEHLILGELVKVDAARRTGQFRADRTGELVDFSLIPEAGPSSVRYLGADAELPDLPPGIRCRFHMYQDEKGAFTRASEVSDEFSYLRLNAVTYRVEAIDLDTGKLHVARQIPEVKNYNGDMERPPDIGRAVLLVAPDTRVWKGTMQVQLTDIDIGDELLINLTSEQGASPSHCSDIWIGAEAHQAATDSQQKKHAVPNKTPLKAKR